jgi:hypothetical protein
MHSERNRSSSTLNSRGKTTTKLTGVFRMILLFTSNHCTWCDVLRKMLEDESDTLGSLQSIFEVDVDRHHHIAEAYGILVVPTLVAGLQKISGVPTQSDLRSFLLHMNPVTQARSEYRSPRIFLQKVRDLRISQGDETSIVRTL